MTSSRPGFPYEETEDQVTSINAVLEDLASGRPMDRLVCGDVGFGKTEVALRASLIAVLAGKQVAVVVPTTLLARQHFHTFTERFRGFPVKIAQASRLVSAKELAEVKKGLKEGNIDIVIGTHALLGKAIQFADLGLLIVDEEQHFGVKHKERLKELREDVHVLTLTATPIPRTLQLALSGVRELSLISTPPVDRLAVRTYVTPFDPMTLREALLRERFRGGQTFFVVPRISDLDEAAAFLQEHAPELKVARAHGQMPPGELDQVMNAFYDRKYDVLLSTTIVESGLDIPSANTLIVYRADMFGLAQLYQLRGRVGRSKIRAYAYFAIPADGRLTPAAEKRLKVLQSLDKLGAGFILASHDLDIRGAGNLLGEEQSGHIREVGFELYQSMLEEAVATLKGGDESIEDQWTPPHQSRHLGSHSGALRPRSASAARSLSPLGGGEQSRGHRGLRRGADRPLRSAARGGAPSPQRGRDQGAVPPGRHRADRRGPEGRRHRLPQQRLRQSGRADRLHPRGRQAGEAAARSPAHLLRQLAGPRGPPVRHARSLEAARQDRRRGEAGGVVPSFRRTPESTVADC